MHSQFNRRTFLRGASVGIALPLLDAMQPAFGAVTEKKKDAAANGHHPNQHGYLATIFFFLRELGLITNPAITSNDWPAHRKQMTVFSGVSLPGVTGGHAAQRCFLTGTPHPERGGFRNGISLDQFAAEQIGNQTRFPSLVLAMTNENATHSFTRSGAPIPAETSARKVFQRLFVQGRPDEVESRVESLRQGRSTLDFVSDQSRRLNRSLSAADKLRMDQYLTAVRELEKRLHSAQEWGIPPQARSRIETARKRTTTRNNLCNARRCCST